MSASRSFLFLQGNASPFYRRLGLHLQSAGQRVVHVNFSGGDRLYWSGPGTLDFRGRAEAFDGFLAERLDRDGVSDLVLFGDCRPLHRVAIAAARARALRVNVFEEGYLRPHWITLERDGVNGHSRLPRDPRWYREKARALPAAADPHAVGGGLRRRIAYDFAWQVANYTGRWRFPHFRTHRPYPIWAEYGAWLWRLARLPLRHRRADALVAALRSERRPYFLFPLQLDSDTQIRVHSHFRRLPAAIDAVIESFARAAPDRARLIVKNHPLDNGWIDYGRQVAAQARRFGLGDRVAFIDGGDLGTLLDGASGLITVNSTVALHALDRDLPVLALGRAIYGLPGLTFDGGLDAFWSEATPPDPQLYRDFVGVLSACCLLNGSFYTNRGVELAVEGAARRLLDAADPLADAPLSAVIGAEGGTR